MHYNLLPSKIIIRLPCREDHDTRCGSPRYVIRIPSINPESDKSLCLFPARLCKWITLSMASILPNSPDHASMVRGKVSLGACRAYGDRSEKVRNRGHGICLLKFHRFQPGIN